MLLRAMVEYGASDLYLKAPSPPTLRISGRARALDLSPITPPIAEKLAREAISDRDWEKLHSERQVDFSFGIKDVGRFRGNIYFQRGTLAAVYRHVKTELPTIEQLGLPDIAQTLAMEQRGLVLVTGATGSGKSTSLAAMIDYRNVNSAGHLVTIEDPIEFLHPDKGCIVSQREVGLDVATFHDGLRAALRQAPDVLLLGEIRDIEAATTALHLSETGHLVFGTLHSTNATQTIERLLQMFPADRHEEICSLLSFNLRGVISQRLLPKMGGGRALAMEVMLGTPRVAELLRRGELGSLRGAIAAGDRDGMITFDQSVYGLYKHNLIDEETAMVGADSPSELKLRMRGFMAVGS